MDQSLQKHIGNTTFDILVNNAGIGQILTLEESTEESFDEVMNFNVKAPFFIIQKALPRLKDGGRIINISSFVTRVAPKVSLPTVYLRGQLIHSLIL